MFHFVGWFKLHKNACVFKSVQEISTLTWIHNKLFYLGLSFIKRSLDPRPRSSLTFLASMSLTFAALNSKQFETTLEFARRYNLRHHICWIICNTIFLTLMTLISRIKWYLTLMCLFLSWYIWCFVRWIALWLSQNTVISLWYKSRFSTKPLN